MAILNSLKKFLTSRTDYSSSVIWIISKNFTSPSGKLRTEFTRPIPKFTIPWLSDMSFLATPFCSVKEPAQRPKKMQQSKSTKIQATLTPTTLFFFHSSILFSLLQHDPYHNSVGVHPSIDIRGIRASPAPPAETTPIGQTSSQAIVCPCDNLQVNQYQL